MRIMIINPIKQGGVTQYTTLLAHALATYEKTFVLASIGSPEYDKLPHGYILRRKLIFPKKANKFGKLLIYLYNFNTVVWSTIFWRPNIIHIEWPLSVKYDSILKKVLNLLGAKVLITAHDLLPHESSAIDVPKYQKMFASFDGIIVHADDNLKRLREQLHVTKPAVVIPHGHMIYLRQINKVFDKTEACKNLDLDPENFYVLFFGYIREYKGLDILIKSLSQITEPRVHLIIAGLAKDFSEYQKQIDELKLTDRVHTFLGYKDIDQISPYFYAADIVALPYRHIWQSGAVQLPLAFGRPIVASRVGGIAETIMNGETGLLVSPENPTELAEAIADYYFNKPLRDKIAQNAFAYVRRELDWSKIAEETIKFYKKILL